MKRRINLLRYFSIPIMAGVIVAVIWANLASENYHYFVKQPIYVTSKACLSSSESPSTYSLIPRRVLPKK